MLSFPLSRLKASRVLDTLHHYFDATALEKRARATGLIQRAGKLVALDFLRLCLLCAHSACSKSLTQLCTLLQEKAGVCLSKQSFDERFSAVAVAFLKACLTDLLDLKLAGEEALLLARPPHSAGCAWATAPSLRCPSSLLPITGAQAVLPLPLPLLPSSL